MLVEPTGELCLNPVRAAPAQFRVDQAADDERQLLGGLANDLGTVLVLAKQLRQFVQRTPCYCGRSLIQAMQLGDGSVELRACIAPPRGLKRGVRALDLLHSFLA